MKINLADGSFSHQLSATLGGENANETPASFIWDRACAQDGGVTFYTDMRLADAMDDDTSQRKIGWLIEPPSLHDGHYRLAWEMREHFDTILTFNREYIAKDGGKYRWYPLGGSWIPLPEWGLFATEKSKTVSLIATQKQRAPGHQMRHAIAAQSESLGVDVWGRGYRPHDSKIPMLRPYRYTIVVESCRLASYFSEKLIDALAQGCVVFYWGCADIWRYFSMDTIISFGSVGELAELLRLASVDDWGSRKTGLAYNQRQALSYRCAEDWIWRMYPELFG